MDVEPDSSPTATGAVSGAEIPGNETGGLPPDGNNSGAPAGVAGLDGVLAEASGVDPMTGPAAIGLNVGARTGVVAGAETEGVGGEGDEAGGDPVGARLTGGEEIGDEIGGEVVEVGDNAGEISGAVDGVDAGGVVAGD
ncbi:hypothetical protein CFOL_v3_12314 [Cephalotus follicularis]|uniref:Uncharacterized protein n=1 Tax=Cephalotus follicularis TaxID=3775 RepID=A0A1Q3BLC7_CEPFO|nr:hypothetical protein CFOL_v3_12314 [Cephalotus follicularis]